MNTETKAQPPLANPPQDRFLRIKDVEEITGLSTSQIYRLQSRDDFPQAVKLSRRLVCWPESRVRDWVQQRINASRPKLGTAK